MKDVTRPDDARFLKSRREPLNTPVEDRTLTPEFNTHWAKLTRAYDEFMFAVHQNSGQQPTVSKWRAFKRKPITSSKAGGLIGNRQRRF